MRYYYLSGVSHIDHFFQIRKKFPNIVPATLSCDVINYFSGKEYVENLTSGFKGPAYRVPLKLLDRAAEQLIVNKEIDDFIFNERLIDLNGIYFAIRLVKLGAKCVTYYDDCSVTDYYKIAHLKVLNLWAWCSWIKNFIKYKFLPICWFETHDGIYLGVSKSYLRRSGIKIEEFKSTSEWNPLFRGSGRHDGFRGLKEGIVVLALGYSIRDESIFFEANERIKIYQEIIKNIPNVYIKYHPSSMIENELKGCSELRRQPIIEEYSDIIAVLISDYSTSLISMSHLNVRSISIIDMIRVIDDKKYSFWKNYLLQSGSNIYFPNNMNELINLCGI
jgi:hypothetical protein